MTIFERIKKLSDRQGLSVSKVAVDLDFSENLFYRWKSSEPKARDLEKVADYFGVTIDYLLGRTDDEKTLVSSAPDDLDKMLDNAMSYEGKKLTEIDRAAIRAYIEGRLDSK